MTATRSLALLCSLVSIASTQDTGRLHLRTDRAAEDHSSVVVDLTDPEPPKSPPLADIFSPPGEAAAAPEQSTDKPEKPADKPEKRAAESDQPTAPSDQPAADSEPGLVVTVSGLSGTAAHLDPATISLKAPFPAKTLGPAPDGWKLLRPDAKVPAFEREVELAPGSSVQLTIRPHVLVPDANGSSIFAVAEPGYDPALEYRQATTIGALLGRSLRQLEQDEQRMGEAIERLEQLLVSLPAAEP